ncbi:predicted protein [Phaeodactylum tricornutum CCAP 1055/1]|jgi:hypothetical protein|uniref:Alpha-type protein kinase domain-containing protein n=2 Tax=Phaeodactylum tricornutum TaxID=2850 RepID=B7G3V2_PHATC|nr:predicted protein [Phaeodactylum tricornutum CCAP 1055/1]EEC46889.1 predicted protein [Phaeodactylum tricornutum CCAP 1055/1]|eukprot:XP_002181675.1 predicted protein [Phaeodactylum tricornutum CCAP 1055/1]
MSSSSAARTNLTSQSVITHRDQLVGKGSFRLVYAGTYVGGNRNAQEAVCKQFKPHCSHLEDYYYSNDFRIIDKAVDYAEDWNGMCEVGKEILVTRGNVMNAGRAKYMVEPLIRDFTRFTSNNGWIRYDGDAELAMEAYCHYTYHRSGGRLIVCDLQGRYRYNSYRQNKCRFELTDPAICSRDRQYGPTDLGEKGIESFFANHECNRFCNWDGYWQRPRSARAWFKLNQGTSMFGSDSTHLLLTCNTARFNASLQPIYDDNEDSSDDDSW